MSRRIQRYTTARGRSKVRRAAAIAAGTSPAVDCRRWARSSSSSLQAKDGPRSRRSAAPKRSKTALVLGGGGFTGGVYEIGALRALDLLTVNRTVNDFDVYVGTSAGAFVAAMTANGLAPEEMMRGVDRQGSAPFPTFELGNLLRPNIARLRARAR